MQEAFATDVSNESGACPHTTVVAADGTQDEPGICPWDLGQHPHPSFQQRSDTVQIYARCAPHVAVKCGRNNVHRV